VKFFACGLDPDNQPVRSVDDLAAYDDLLSAVETGVERDAADRKDTVLSLDLSVEAGEEAAEDVLNRLDRGSMPTREKLRLVGLLKSLGVDDERLAEVAPEVVPGSADPDGDDDNSDE
jgi:crotonobetainyl-CoA:carnitine CoA-transferase CaiB-like acyl-CoA transferase